jgi:hypothetical protein
MHYRTAAITIHDQSPMALLPRVVERIWRDYVAQWPELQGQHDEFVKVVNGGGYA